MATTTFSGPVRAGTVKEGPTINKGYMNQLQTVDFGNLAGTGTGNVDATFYLPAGAEIVDIIFDTLTAFTVATATVSVGLTAGGTDYAPATAVTSAGRLRPTFTAAQLTAGKAVASGSLTNIPIIVRLAITVGTVGAGSFEVKIIYAQK